MTRSSTDLGVAAPGSDVVTGASATAGPAVPTGTKRRLAGLDGIRGLAALSVVFHHTYLMAFPGYPRITGPLWAGWLIYGHFAVAVFIVLSGFSLAVAPARSGWRMGSTGRFFFRRAWRILPTYWPALLFSLAVAWWITAQPGESLPTIKSVFVNGLLVQDIVNAPTPNGAFWSIAVEAQLYFVFPLLILATRRLGQSVMLSLVAMSVILINVLAPHVSLVDKLLRFTPQFALLFAMGVAAASVVRVGHRRAQRRVSLGWCAVLAGVPVLAWIAIAGSVWTLNHLFWIDVALGPAIALSVAAVAGGGPARTIAVLDSRPLKSLGSFSYSLYLVHAPIVVAWYVTVIQPSFGRGTEAFLVAIATGVPLSLIVARLFAAVFELPFTRYKSWPALSAAVRQRIVAVRERFSPQTAPAEIAETNG